MVIGKSRGYSLKHWPFGRMAHRLNLVGGRADQLHKQRHGITSATGCKHLSKLFDVFLPYMLSFWINTVRRLVHRKLFDFITQPHAGFQGKRRTRRMSVDAYRFASFINQCLDILNLPLDCIGFGILTVASSPTVIVVYRKVWLPGVGSPLPWRHWT